MRYWRMQLHPDEPEYATYYTVECLMNSYIGLGFEGADKDLSSIDYNSLETTPNNIYAFVHDISKDDWILIFHHNAPFALVTELGPYNFIKMNVPEMNIWFRHFRRFNKEKLSFYYDVFKTGINKHSGIKMTNTFSEASEDSETVKLIKEWIALIL